MFKSYIRSISNNLMRSSQVTSTALKPSTSITIYHNTNSLLSNSLLAKLNNYSELPCTLHKYKDSKSNQVTYNTTITSNRAKFNVDLKLNQQLSQQDFDFMVGECVDIHPDNRSILIQLLLNDSSKQKSKLLKNFDLHDQQVNFDAVKHNTKKFPIIIDYTNKLIANDETSFDRIISNYISCGIQNFLQSKPVRFVEEVNSNNSGNYLTFKQQPQQQSQTQQQQNPLNHNLIHPHIAEFADLF